MNAYERKLENSGRISLFFGFVGIIIWFVVWLSVVAAWTTLLILGIKALLKYLS